MERSPCAPSAASHERTVDLIVQGHGSRGPCFEYLENTVHHLQALGLRDRALERLLKEARQRAAPEGP